MVESDFDAESCGGSAAGDARSEIHAPVLRREPSFSRWCDEDAIEQSLQSSEDATASEVEDGEFELPLLRVERYLNGGSNMEERNEGGMKFAPFSVENQYGRKMRFLGLKGDNGKWESKVEAVQTSQSSISMANLLRTLFYILVWYTFSTCLTLYNKTLLGEKLGKFPAPFLMNAIHFGMQAIVSRAIVRFWSQKLQPNIKMSWRDYFIRVVPTAVGTALDINLSNISLVFISVTFATMCKSASPIFLLLFAFAFKLETPSIKLLGIIFIISVGILLTVARETEFEFWGFIFVMLAAVMSGFRWSMTQILLQKEAYGLHHPLTFMSYVTPVMAVVTALLSFMMDPWYKFKGNDYFSNSRHILQTCLVLLAGGALAFSMVVTEYILVATTSAITVTVAGVVKEAVMILIKPLAYCGPLMLLISYGVILLLLSVVGCICPAIQRQKVAVIYFHDQFTVLKGIGLMIIMVGVSLFNWYKYNKLQRGHLKGDGEIMSSTATNGAAKYAILDDMDDQEDAATAR